MSVCVTVTNALSAEAIYINNPDLRIEKWSEVKGAQLCLTLCDPMDCSPSGSSVHGVLQARILEWVAIPSSRGSSQSRDRICTSYVSCIAGRFLTCWAIEEAPSAPKPGTNSASTEWMRQLSVAMAALKESRWGHGMEGIKDTEYLERGKNSSCFLMDTEGLRDSKTANTSLGTWRRMIRCTPDPLTDLLQHQTADKYFLDPDLPLPLPAVASESN